MAWRVAESEYQETLEGRSRQKNPMRDSYLSTESPSPREKSSLSIDLSNLSDGTNDATIFESDLGISGESVAESSKRGSKKRVRSRQWSGPSPRTRTPSDLEESLTPRSNTGLS